MGRIFKSLVVVVCLVIGLSRASAREEINHMIGIYFHEKSLEFLEHNLDQILEINGYSSTDYFHQSINKRLPLTKFDEFFKDNADIQKVAKTIRTNFVKFLEGIRIKDKHEFEIDANGIEATVDWEKFGVKFAPSTVEHFNSRNEILIEAHIKARRMRLLVNELRLRDHQHKFLGDLGGNGFYIELDRQHGAALNIVLPARVKLLPNGGLDVKIETPRHNLSQIVLGTGWNPPLLLPKVEIRINGRRAFLKMDEIEQIIRGQIPRLTSGLSKMAQEFLDNELAPMLTEKINALTNKGHTEINEMDPVGVPDNMIDVKYRWGLTLSELDFMGQKVHFGLRGFVEDPKLERDLPLIRSQIARSNPLPISFNNEEFDVALTLNQAFVNRILQYSNTRGYFKNMKMADNSKLQLVNQPFINFIGKGMGKPATMTIKTKYVLTGWKKIFIRNPMEIQADLVLAFNQNENGQLTIVIDGIDPESASIENRFIRVFKKKVRKELKNTLKKMGQQIKGQVLSDGLPLPSELAGVPMKILRSKIDPMGHLIMFMDLTI